MDTKLSPKSLKEVWNAFVPKLRDFRKRSRLPLLLLLYPILSWLLLAASSGHEGATNTAPLLVAVLFTGTYTLIGVALGFCLAAPLWASRYRARPADLPPAFRRGLYGTFALVAFMLPAQAIVLGLALYAANPKELWFWTLFVLGGSITATVILLRSGLREKPTVYVTLRAKRLDLDQHPRLAANLREVSENLHAPLPPNILVGLQPETLWFFGSVFCPDGELQGGVLCLSLPLAFMLSIAEFSALAGDALPQLYASTWQRRTELQSTIEGARQVVTNLQVSMQEWRWYPKYFLHPYFVILRFVAVAAIRFHLYLGKEIVIFFVSQFLESRSYADTMHMVETHHVSSASVGRVQVLSALIKEAALSMGMRWQLWRDGAALHPLGEVMHLVLEQHPNFTADLSFPTPWRNPDVAWGHLQLRSDLSQLSLNWCLQMAKEVSPEPSAASLFDDPAGLERELVEIVNSPYVVAKQRAAGAAE